MRDFSVTIFGVGKVGSTIAFSCILKDVCESIDIIDTDLVSLVSQHSDLLQAKETHNRRTKIAMPIEPRESDVYVICAGERRGTNKCSREVLYKENFTVVKPILEQIKKVRKENSLVLMVTNPSTELSKLALDYVPLVFPCGNLIDNARLRLCRVQGPHEKPDIEQKCLDVVNGKGYTNFAIATEVLVRINQWRSGLNCLYL